MTNSAFATAVILTLNEEKNLPACLESLSGWCQPIFIVDSGSTDGTAAIARRFGAELIPHPFETHSKQWNWALANLPGASEWVLALDADHRVSPELREEILRAIAAAPGDLQGFYVPRKQIFRGRWIRHGGYWPKYLLKLFRNGSACCDERELLDSRFTVEGSVGFLKQPLIEENLKEREILFWLQKHLRYVELQAQEEYRYRRNPDLQSRTTSPLGTPDQRILWLKQIWYRLPLGLRPFLYFGYRYFFQLGFLDGAEGALFHFLQAFWFRWMVDVRLGELLRAEKS